MVSENPNVLSGLIGGKLTTGAGAGFSDAAIYESSVQRGVGGIIKTSILLDLTGVDVNAVGDIIGDTGEAAAYIGQINASESGTIVAGKVTCLEVPAGGDPDIDLYSATEATGTEDAAITGLTETALLDGGDMTLGSVGVLSAFPADGEYLYLVSGAGATVFAAYTAGKILIELYGTA